MDPKERLIFALDVNTGGQAVELVKTLKDEVGVFKIGLELFVSQGPAVVQMVREAGAGAIFLDLKLHDIPATMRQAALAAVSLGVEFLTCHADQAGIFTGLDLGGTRLLGITVLTSLGPEDLAAMGYPEKLQDPKALVALRAKLAQKAGCAGVVCSGQEAAAVRRELGPESLVICPGIRLGQGAEMHDQKRVMTPELAIKNGASHIVVGRPIRTAEDPAGVAGLVCRGIAKGLETA